MNEGQDKTTSGQTSGVPVQESHVADGQPVPTTPSSSPQGRVDPNARPHVEKSAGGQGAPAPTGQAGPNPKVVRSHHRTRAMRGEEPFKQMIVDDTPMPDSATSDEAREKQDMIARGEAPGPDDVREVQHQEGAATPGLSGRGGSAAAARGRAAGGPTTIGGR